MRDRWFVFGFLTPLTLVALVAGFLVHAFRTPGPRRAHVRPPSQYAVHGIDVSHHQGAIDWGQVAASGDVQFAWIKATQGATHTDRRFTRNWADARAAGLKVGAYHYFSMCRGGASQADHFIATVPKVADALPPAVDVEEDSRCNRVPPATLQSALDTYLERVRAHYGARPIVYGTRWYLSEHLAAPAADLWLAGYSRQPRGSWLFWQYTDRGRIPGISGPVDRNVYAGAHLGDLGPVANR